MRLQERAGSSGKSVNGGRLPANGYTKSVFRDWR